ncbi:MAG: 1,2-dihydroxy-3-keto-5-methylthiopentene dioxygenase, partial [Candidatus Acidiferrales bacterium]
MAVVCIPEENRTLTARAEITQYLAGIGIDYERWEPTHAVPADAPAEQVLAAYAPEIDRLKASGGYVTADVIDIFPQTPGLDTM